MFNIVRLDGRDSIGGWVRDMMEERTGSRGIVMWGSLPCPQEDPARIASHAKFSGCIDIRYSERCAIHDLDNFYRWWPRTLWEVLCNPDGDHEVQLRIIRVTDPHAVRIGERQVVYPGRWDVDSEVIPVAGLDPAFIEAFLPQHFNRWDIYLGPGADNVPVDYR